MLRQCSGPTGQVLVQASGSFVNVMPMQSKWLFALSLPVAFVEYADFPILSVGNYANLRSCHSLQVPVHLVKVVLGEAVLVNALGFDQNDPVRPYR